MKKTVLICGLIAGLISTSLYIGLMLLGKAGDIDFKNGMIYGYTLMILAFSFCENKSFPLEISGE